MTTDQINKLKEALAKASPAPWTSVHHSVSSSFGTIAHVSCTTGRYQSEENNRNLIALLRNHATALIQAAEENVRLRAQLERAVKLAGIAYDWDLGTDGRIEIDGEWINCLDLRNQFKKELSQP